MSLAERDVWGECWPRLARRRDVATRGDALDDGLDLDGLDAVRARQPKTCISAHPRSFGVKCKEPAGWRRRATSQSSRGGGCQRTGGSPGRSDRSSTRRRFVWSSSGGGAVPVKFFLNLDPHRGVDFLHLAREPSQFFSVRNSGAGHRRGAGGAMTTDVRCGGHVVHVWTR